MIDAAPAGTDQSAGAERARIAAILRSPEAEARIATAIALALDTDLSAGEAVKVLRVCPAKPNPKRRAPQSPPPAAQMSRRRFIELGGRPWPTQRSTRTTIRPQFSPATPRWSRAKSPSPRARTPRARRCGLAQFSARRTPPTPPATPPRRKTPATPRWRSARRRPWRPPSPASTRWCSPRRPLSRSMIRPATSWGPGRRNRVSPTRSPSPPPPAGRQW